MTIAPASIRLTMNAGDWGLLVALSVLWGGSFLFVGVAVRELPVLSIVASRVALAAVALWAVVALRGLAVPRGPAAWRALAVMGVINNVIPFSLIVWAQTRIEAGLASILNATTPLFGVIVAGLLLTDERLSARRLAGAALGFGGVAAMMGADAVAGLGGDVAAQGAMLGASFAYALSGVWARRFSGLGLSPLVTAAGMLSVSSVLLVPVALFERPWTLAPSGAALASVAALALVSTALAYILYFRLVARAGATNLLLVTLLIPVTAIGLGATLLGERLGVWEAVGMALIAAGLSVIDGRLWSRLSRRPR